MIPSQDMSHSSEPAAGPSDDLDRLQIRRVTAGLHLDAGHPDPIRCRPHQKLESWAASNRHPVSNGLSDQTLVNRFKEELVELEDQAFESYGAGPSGQNWALGPSSEHSD